eukprot:TRINITY_DN60400_c0_g1_i1.p1 TRINITY_DN60400_c0_g1~~TRINITY_DN60400_c0_g1_i1.p1  ORF type:complete len:183 (+),score=36.80 TRINITY_DN60400_c0_g1_i1:311-859(+)
MDVRVFDDMPGLVAGLMSLASQPLSVGDAVLVQEWIEFSCELRLFFVEPQIQSMDGKLQHVDASQILYTTFEQVDSESRLRSFRRHARHEVLAAEFEGDQQALYAAEQQATVLANKLLVWLRTESAEPPTVLRFDFMVRRSGPGTADVWTGEITETGACFLGWKDGPDRVWNAVLRSCLAHN